MDETDQPIRSLWDQVILFGDSITQQSFDQQRTFGTGAALTNAYVRKLDVVNRGFSGYNSTLALTVLPRIIPSPKVTKVRLLTIWFGANDARLPNTGGGTQQHVPLEKYKENLKAMVTHPCLRAHTDLKILLITPGPVDERRLIEDDEHYFPELGRHPPPRRTAKNASLYAAAVRDIGKATGCAVLDLWSAMMKRAGYDGGRILPGAEDAPLNEQLREYVHDGLHFSGAGYGVLYEELMATIERTWPELMPEQLPRVLPGWADEDLWAKEGITLVPSAM